MWRRDMRRETERETGNPKGRPDGRGKGETWLTRAARVAWTIVGAPDYKAYLEHCRLAGHAPTLGEREYVAQFFESKGRGVRCC
jgi:uncharacterized short protein YbdD (DUF466 family)